MTVHVDSVIPSWVNTLDSAFYNSLTDQENWAYLNPSPGLKSDWITLFTSLVTALNTWKNTNRQNNVADLVQVMYGVRIMSVKYNIGIVLTGFSAPSYATIGGFIASCKARAVNYYGDYSAGSAKITADIATINSGAATELSGLASGVLSMASSLKPHSHKLMFDGLPTVAEVTHAEVCDYIFNTLGYKNYYNALNVGTLTVPTVVI
jgi:hypothetical protein